MPSISVRHCPGCGSVDLRPSRSGRLRFLARLVFLHPIRCTSCRQRFWRFALRPPPVQYAQAPRPA